MHNLVKFVAILVIFLHVHVCVCSPDVKRLQKTLSATDSKEVTTVANGQSMIEKKKTFQQCTDSTSIACCVVPEIVDGVGEVLSEIPEVGEIVEIGVAIYDVVNDIVCYFDSCGNCVDDCCAGSCFSPETAITMADGSLKRIDQVKVGDWVATAKEGEIAQVMFIDVAPSQGRSLYGFGADSQPFVSEDHVLISNSEGFVSIDVKKAVHFEPQFTNQLTTLKNGVDLRVWKDGQFRSENVSHIVKQSIADPNTILYNLILKTGHSFIANGYAVSDHFPDLSQFPKMFKLLHWILRENLAQVESFFADHNKYDMKPLVQQITQLITNYVKHK